MLFGEIGNRTSDPHQRVRIIGTVLDGHQERDVDADLIVRRNPGFGNLQGFTAHRDNGMEDQVCQDERHTIREKPFDTGTQTSKSWHCLPPRRNPSTKKLWEPTGASDTD